MSPRIEIAMACGYRCVHPTYQGATSYWHVEAPDGRPISQVFDVISVAWDNANEIPDYFNDLNAMHEAEKLLEAHQLDDYVKCLHSMCEVCDVFATAAQRAEAFLRTIGKWEVDRPY